LSHPTGAGAFAPIVEPARRKAHASRRESNTRWQRFETLMWLATAAAPRLATGSSSRPGRTRLPPQRLPTPALGAEPLAADPARGARGSGYPAGKRAQYGSSDHLSFAEHIG
jgi:hypothetical protein